MPVVWRFPSPAARAQWAEEAVWRHRETPWEEWADPGHGMMTIRLAPVLQLRARASAGLPISSEAWAPSEAAHEPVRGLDPFSPEQRSVVAAGALAQTWVVERLGRELEAVERERREPAKGAESLRRVMVRQAFRLELVARAKTFAEEAPLPDGTAQGALGVRGSSRSERPNL